MTHYATATAKDLEVKTAPLVVKVGVTPLAAVPRPDLSGQRLQDPDSGAIYLVDPNGYLRWIPDPDTYNNLFRDWCGRIPSTNLVDIAAGSALTSGAVLAQSSGEAKVYLISNGVCQWITSPAAMDKYYFNWNTVIQVPHVLLDFIRGGPSWS